VFLGLLVDEYRKNWAIRYLREAEADLYTAEQLPNQVSSGLAIMAMRKAQTSIYYCLGDPSYLMPIVNSVLESKAASMKPLLRLLTDIEAIIRSYSEDIGVAAKSDIINKARSLLEVASRLASIILKSN
jgi:hypothetical protein